MKPFEHNYDVDQVSGCWVWKRCIGSKGYGLAYWRGKKTRAHRAVYEASGLTIPAGLQLDHLCRNRACVNPEHLEPVTNRENTIRGVRPQQLREKHAAQTHCVHGHEYTPDNTRVCKLNKRHCRACEKARTQRRTEQARQLRS